MKKINLQTLNLQKIRKRAGIISIGIILGVFAFVFQIGDYDKEKESGMIQKVNGVPVEERIVILDAGHGNPEQRGA